MNIFIESAKVIDNRSKYHNKIVNIKIKNGEITAIGPSVKNTENYKIIKEKNLHVSIGWFDLRARFCDPGYEFKEDLQSGAKAAAKSGFTGVCVMPNTLPPIDSKSGIDYIKKQTSNLAIDVYPTGCVSHNREGKELAELFDMHQAGAVAFTDDKRYIQNPNLINRALLYSKAFNGLIMDFPNDDYIFNNGHVYEGPVSLKLGLKGIPELSEEIAVSRDLFLMDYAETKLHLSAVSAPKSFELIAKAKKQNKKITTDVNVVNLYFSDEDVANFDTNLKVLPPLKPKTTIKKIIKGLNDGTIDTICSDHTPEIVENKKVEFDNAAFGAETLEAFFGAINYILHKDMDLGKLIELITLNPRNILNLPIPTIETGEKANLTLFNPDIHWVFDENAIISKSKNSPFIGKPLKGKALGIINNNQMVSNF
ncbi:MAG: dihydroorotase [Vicingaceae bacterium]